MAVSINEQAGSEEATNPFLNAGEVARDPILNPKRVSLTSSQLDALQDIINAANADYDTTRLQILDGAKSYANEMIQKGNARQLAQGEKFRPAKPGDAIVSMGGNNSSFGVEFDPTSVPETSVPLEKGYSIISTASEKIRAYFDAHATTSNK